MEFHKILVLSLPIDELQKTIYYKRSTHNCMRKFFIALVVIIFFFLFSFHSKTVYAQACTTPGTVTNVKITYPACANGQCSFTSATCTWDATLNAATYTVKVTEVDTNTIVTSQSITAPTTTITFPVTSGKTYKCDVTAVNSCGQAGGTGSDSLLCKVDGVFASPTAVPTQPPIIGAPNPQPTLAPTGNLQNILLITGVSIILIITGASLFLL